MVYQAVLPPSPQHALVLEDSTAFLREAGLRAGVLLAGCLSSGLLSLLCPVGQKSLGMHFDVEAAEGLAEGCCGRPRDSGAWE